MELIKEALLKAKSGQEAFREREHHDRPLGPRSPEPPLSLRGPQSWSPPRVELDPAHLERSRIVAQTMTDSNHVSFNLLRTKVYRMLRANNWRSIAVTSPTAGCGKTMVSVNLAISLARQPGCRTVLLDLDLKRPSVARALGVEAEKSAAQYFEREANFTDCFFQIGDNLIVCANGYSVRHPTDRLTEGKLVEFLQQVESAFSPQVTILDLPPMLVGDEAITILPHADSNVLVTASGLSTASQIEECLRQIDSEWHMIGVVLNKARELPNEYYDYK